MFEIGQSVIFVDVSMRTSSPLRARALPRLRVGAVYVVEGIGWSHHNNWPTVVLSGVANSDIVPEWRDQWAAYRFRKLRKAEQSAREQWTEMLNAPAKVSA